MLIVIDVGNTQATCGIYRGRRLVKTWRVPTAGAAVRVAGRIVAGIGRRDVSGVCICSVVPRIDKPLVSVLRRRVTSNVLVVTASTIGMPIVGYRRREIGTDRLVNALAAWHHYRRALIIVDFGTATTFDVVSPRGEYRGGAIAPGINLANRSLYEFTAKLPRAPIKKTRRTIGHRTIESMQAGVFHGYAGLVTHLIHRIRREMHAYPTVIATGGLARLISSSVDEIDAIHPDLTLEGLRLIWQLNASSR